MYPLRFSNVNNFFVLIIKHRLRALLFVVVHADNSYKGLRKRVSVFALNTVATLRCNGNLIRYARHKAEQ